MKKIIGIWLVSALASSLAMAQGNKPASIQETTVDSVALKEVVVTASKPLSRIEGDGILTTIKGTVLSNLGTAKDVLGFIPGVTNNNGTIEVFGKGTPLIYINGRKMRNNLELEQLKSEKIKDIKLINNPGARYDAEVNAVIRITTVKEPGNGFALDTKTTAGYRDYLYAKELVNLNYRSGGLDVFGTFEYDHTRSKSSNTSIQNAWTERHAMTRLNMYAKEKSQLFEGQAGFNYSTASGHSFGGYYQTLHKPSKSDSKNASSFWLDGKTQDNGFLTQQNKNSFYEHLADGYYSGNWGKWTADATFDFLWRNLKNRQTVQEEREMNGFSSLNINDRSKGLMFAGEFHLSRPVWKGNLNLGTEYTDSRREDNFYNVEATIDNSNDIIKENNLAFYGEMMQRFGKVTLQIGLRYEHIKSDYFNSEHKVHEQSRTYNELLPSATLVIPVKQAMLQLGYARKYTRPAYEQLSNTVNYVNKYVYESGNPLLRTPFSDNVSLNFRYKWLMVMASYRHVNDLIISSCMPYEKDPTVTLLKKDNSKNSLHNLQVMLSVMPGFIGKVYYPVLACGVVSQFYETDYQGQTKDMNRPMMVVQFNNIFRLPKDYMLTANLSWRSEGDGENIRMGQSWQTNLSASKTFNKHWDVKLSLNDLFNTARNVRYTLYSGVRDIHMEKCMNTRQVELSIGYKFNITKSRYKGKGAGNEEKTRL